MHDYDHKEIEKKWQDTWNADNQSVAKDDPSLPKSFLLVEFPYPSGAGLHTGHVRSYTAMDVIARKKRAEGLNVLYPIGWDAFGLPTENFAIKTGRPPEEITKENTDTFRRQLKSMGISFDWAREINTTDPAYYKWTQWIFIQMYNAGLAYKAKSEINWCPKDKIGLANEEVVDGKCERCGTDVEKREKEQWMLAITKYAQRLYDDLETVDYIERAKTQQRNWIGPSEGAKISFALVGHTGPEGMETLEIFTTRPDTIYGATFIGLSAELAQKWITAGWQTSDEVSAFVRDTIKEKASLGRNAIAEKLGIDSGIFAINPATQEQIPIWITNYVLGDVGTGAIMAVPAHDERDFEFAKKYNLQIKCVIDPYSENLGALFPGDSSLSEATLVAQNAREEIHNGNIYYQGVGTLMNSAEFDELDSTEARKIIVGKIGAKQTTTYKLRDWVFSRQRYWGEPIPMINCAKCGWVPVPIEQLPVTLPKVASYEYTDTGESPLASMSDWVNTTCPTCGGKAKRETDTMPNWAGSSWYYLRYVDPANASALADRKKLDYWTPVDWYNGGMEHTVLHLLYSRFWHKFLFDIGVVPTSEPYLKRTSHGMILAGDGEKMSKSRGNVVNPDEIVERFGADTLRVYEMFMGPFDQAIAWSIDGLVGARRFLERIVALSKKVHDVSDADFVQIEQVTIKKVTEDIELMKFNTAISSLMIFANALQEKDEVPKSSFLTLLKLLSPFVPHLSEELWHRLNMKSSVHKEKWPAYNASLLQKETVSIAIQVNGKLRGTITIKRGATKEVVDEMARKENGVAVWLAGKELTKVIHIEDKIISYVVSP